MNKSLDFLKRQFDTDFESNDQGILYADYKDVDDFLRNGPLLIRKMKPGQKLSVILRDHPNPKLSELSRLGLFEACGLLTIFVSGTVIVLERRSEECSHRHVLKGSCLDNLLDVIQKREITDIIVSDTWFMLHEYTDNLYHQIKTIVSHQIPVHRIGQQRLWNIIDNPELGKTSFHECKSLPPELILKGDNSSTTISKNILWIIGSVHEFIERPNLKLPKNLIAVQYELFGLIHANVHPKTTWAQQNVYPHVISIWDIFIGNVLQRDKNQKDSKIQDSINQDPKTHWLRFARYDPEQFQERPCKIEDSFWKPIDKRYLIHVGNQSERRLGFIKRFCEYREKHNIDMFYVSYILDHQTWEGYNSSTIGLLMLHNHYHHHCWQPTQTRFFTFQKHSYPKGLRYVFAELGSFPEDEFLVKCLDPMVIWFKADRPDDLCKRIDLLDLKDMNALQSRIDYHIKHRLQY